MTRRSLLLFLPVGLVCGFQASTNTVRPSLRRLTTHSHRIPSLSRPFRSIDDDALSKHRSRTSLDTSSTITPVSGTEEEEDAATPSFLSVLWRFTRPHTIIGSALAIPALHFLAAPTYAAAWSAHSLGSMVYAMIPALLMNLYITGLNQVTDVDIDKINKPTLPIAAGDLSMKNGIIIILIALFGSLGMGFAHPVFSTEGLNVALWVSGILGTLYSLEPFRLKRFPFLAAFCIVSVRGAVINAGFFAHARAAAFGATSGTTTTVWKCLTSDPSCMLSSLYFAVFGIVIALMKDVPDVKGDELSNVRTFSVRLGQKRVFSGMHRLLTGLLLGVGGGFLRGAMSTTAPRIVQVGRGVVALSALVAGWSVQKEAAPVDPRNPQQVYEFYMHLWKLFYLSYLVLPLAR